jgi:uncharacterized protein (DUF1501 family)
MGTTRREFLVSGLWVGAAAPLFAFPPARRRASEGERVLVVVQLTGGNDGLNTLIPHRQDAYYRLRPTLAIARGELHALDDDHGLHPSMRGLAELHAEGQLTCVHGVGTPNADRSHFRSMEMWHTADPENPPGDTGWLGRLGDQLARSDPSRLVAVHVGDEDLPLAMWGRDFRAPTVRDPKGFRLEHDDIAFAAGRDALLARADGAGSLAFLRDAARNAYDAATRMEALAERSSPVEYPGTGLARRLQLVARLVAGGFGTRIFQVTLGGFDTHSRQAPVHAPLLAELSGALTAFHRDLEHHGWSDRVATLVFSEFGRRATENASRGTDHGAGAPAFVVGGGLRGGMHGGAPDLESLVDGDVPTTTDFRRLYSALERDWMGLEASTGVKPLDVVG